jgi:hypothetical protein
MSDVLRKHRVIGIRHTLKEIREAGLISSGVTYPEDAVTELKKTLDKANGAKRHRAARSDSSIPSLLRSIEETFRLPSGSVQLVYPSGRRAGANASVGSFRRNWKRSEE